MNSMNALPGVWRSVVLLALALTHCDGARAVDKTGVPPSARRPPGDATSSTPPTWLSRVRLEVSVEWREPSAPGAGGPRPARMCFGPDLLRGPCDSPDPHGPDPAISAAALERIGDLGACLLAALRTEPMAGFENPTIDLYVSEQGPVRAVLVPGDMGATDEANRCIRTAEKAGPGMAPRPGVLHVRFHFRSGQDGRR